MVRMSIIFTMAFVLIALTSAATAQVSFTASADKTIVPKGGQVTVVATLVWPKAVSGVPQPEPSDEFDVVAVNTGQSQSRNIQFVNGRIEQQVEYVYKYIYTIVSKVDGAFTFPALSVNIDGNSLSSRPLRFNVGGGNGGPTGVSGGGGIAGGGEPADGQDIKAFLNISKKTLFSGEQTVLTFKIAQKVNAPIQTQRGYMGAIEQIENAFGKGFSLNRLFTNQVTQGQERFGGEQYNTFTLKFAVFGLTAGEYSVPAITFEYDEIRQMNSRRSNPFFQDFFDMGLFDRNTQSVRKIVRTAPFNITVKPIVDKAPTGFAGSVGKFNISASVEPETVAAGEALTLKVTLKGNTRASNVGDPTLPKLDNCDVFAPERQITVDTGAGDGGFSTKKTYRYLIIPRVDGEMILDPITYPYLDPESGTYKTARTNPLKVTVTKGIGGAKEQTRYLTQEEIRQIGQDIRFIKTPSKLTHQNVRPYNAAVWYILFPTPFLIFLFILFYKLQSERIGKNQYKSIRQKALSIATKELNAAVRSNDDRDFLIKTAAIIEKYISDKFAFPITGRTHDELTNELLARGVDKQTVVSITALIEEINAYRFGGKTYSATERSRDEIVRQTINNLNDMEKSMKKGEKSRYSSSKTAPLIRMLFIPFIAAALIWPAAALSTPIEYINARFKTANDFYAAETYDSALIYYRDILKTGTVNDAVYYNMGNCYFRLRQPGWARFYYEKAAVLSPKDEDINANINYIKTIIIDRVADNPTESEFIAAVTRNVHTLLPLETQLIILCALLFVLALVCSAMLFKKGLTRLWLAYGAVLCALLIAIIGTSAGYKVYALEIERYAIVVTPSVDAKNQPSGAQTLFTAHEGTKLRVSQTIDDWSYVSLPNGASGWVTTESLGTI